VLFWQNIPSSVCQNFPFYSHLLTSAYYLCQHFYLCIMGFGGGTKEKSLAELLSKAFSAYHEVN
jgi:hypothetical protein